MYKLFKRFQRKEVSMILLCLLFIVGQVWLDLTMPDYMSEITTLVQTEGSAMADIWLAGGKMLLCALGSLILSVMTGFLAAQVAASFSMRLRAGIFRQVESFSMEEIGRFSTASLITRTTNDVTQIQFLIAMGLQVILKAPIMAVWAICKIQSKSWQWTAATFAAVAFMLVLIVIAVTFAMPRFKRIQALTDNLNRVTRENLTGLRVVRAYNAEGYQEEKFQEANQKLTSNNLSANRVMAIMFPGMNLVMNGLTLAIYWIGAYLIGAIPSPAGGSCDTAAGCLFQHGGFLLLCHAGGGSLHDAGDDLYHLAPGLRIRQAGAGGTGNPFLHHRRRPPGRSSRPGGRGGIPECVLPLSRRRRKCGGACELPGQKGQTVAFIGATGSGKSSLINLIPPVL